MRQYSEGAAVMDGKRTTRTQRSDTVVAIAMHESTASRFSRAYVGAEQAPLVADEAVEALHAAGSAVNGEVGHCAADGEVVGLTCSEGMILNWRSVYQRFFLPTCWSCVWCCGKFFVLSC